MASIYDFEFLNEGVDTDPLPKPFEHTENDFNTDVIDDANYEEPGAGTTFSEQDPTVWSTMGEPDSPEKQQSDVPPTETGPDQTEQMDPAPALDAETEDEQENAQYEDDNESDTADPADIDAGRDIDPTNEIRVPDPDADDDLVTDRVPAPPEVIVERVLEELLDDIRAELFDYGMRLLDEGELLRIAEDTVLDDMESTNERFLDNAMNAFASFSSSDLEGDMTVTDDFFTAPALLADFGDIIGSVDMDTMLQEFQLLYMEDS